MSKDKNNYYLPLAGVKRRHPQRTVGQLIDTLLSDMQPVAEVKRELSGRRQRFSPFVAHSTQCTALGKNMNPWFISMKLDEKASRFKSQRAAVKEGRKQRKRRKQRERRKQKKVSDKKVKRTTKDRSVVQLPSSASIDALSRGITKPNAFIKFFALKSSSTAPGSDIHRLPKRAFPSTHRESVKEKIKGAYLNAIVSDVRELRAHYIADWGRKLTEERTVLATGALRVTVPSSLCALRAFPLVGIVGRVLRITVSASTVAPHTHWSAALPSVAVVVLYSCAAVLFESHQLVTVAPQVDSGEDTAVGGSTSILRIAKHFRGTTGVVSDVVSKFAIVSTSTSKMNHLTRKDSLRNSSVTSKLRRGHCPTPRAPKSEGNTNAHPRNDIDTVVDCFEIGEQVGIFSQLSFRVV